MRSGLGKLGFGLTSVDALIKGNIFGDAINDYNDGKIGGYQLTESGANLGKSLLGFSGIGSAVNFLEFGTGKYVNMLTGEQSAGLIDFVKITQNKSQEIKYEALVNKSEFELHTYYSSQGPDKLVQYLIIRDRLKEREKNKNPCPPNGGAGGTQKPNPKGNGPGTVKLVLAIGPKDPNEIIGPDGQPANHWVSVHDRLPYTILYENDKTASAPAKFVRVTSPIEPKQDAATFQLGNFGFNNQSFTVPPNTASYYQRLDCRDSLGLYVDITAGYDQINNVAFWEFQSIDPITLLPPSDPLKGFLLLQDSSQILYGHGFVNFSIKPIQTAITLDTIGARASIVFDFNDTIPTNIAKNTIDALPPTTHLNSVVQTVTPGTFRMSWHGNDDPGGSGIASYSLYVSVNSRPFALYRSNIIDTSLLFTGIADTTYCFFIAGKDSVKNEEPLSINCDLSVTPAGIACGSASAITAGSATTFCDGGSVTLISSAAGGNQWYKDGVAIIGAINQTYNATTGGNYTVVVTAGGCSSPASSATTVTVNGAPSIPTITAGSATGFCDGGSVTLTSSAAGGNQWYKDGVTIIGAINQTYSATTGGNYTVVVTAGGCSSPASSATTVTVNGAPATPTITAGSATGFCDGGSVTLTSSAAGGNQWYKGGVAIIGAINQTYSATTGGNYTVVVTAGGCSSPASSATTVAVNAAPATPTITAGSATGFCDGGSVTLTSSAAGGNQWYKGGVIIIGAINQTYSATTGGNYTVVVTAGGCSSPASSATTVTVNGAPATPTITAGSATGFCDGGSVTLTSSAAGGNQWYKGGVAIIGEINQTYSATTGGNYTVVVTAGGCSSPASSATTVTVNGAPSTPTITAGSATGFCDGGSVTLTSSAASGNQWYKDGVVIIGAINQTYSATTGGNYTVVVTAGGCSSPASTATTVTINAAPATPTITAGSATGFCDGGSVTLTSSAAGGNQWYKDGVAISGEINQTYSATTGGNYTVVVTAGGCSSPASSATTVTVNAIPSIPTITAGGSTTFCAGGSVTLTSSSASGNKWYKNGTAISGAASIQQTYNATTSGNYTVVVTTNGCSSPASAAITVTVNPIPAKPTISAGSAITFCDGGSVTLTSSAAGGNQWYKGGVSISGATNQTYGATTGGSYTVVVTAGGCSSPASTPKTITVEPIPSTPTIIAGSTTTFCSGGSVALTSSSASGNKWYKNGTVISGAASIQQTYNATTSGNYTVVVTTNGCSSPASAAITVTVNPIPAKPTISAGSATTFCDGGSVTLTSSAAGGNQWYKDGVAITGEANQAYSATAGGNYTVAVTAGGCSSPASTPKTITVEPIPSIPTITAGSTTTFCSGGSVALTSSAASGNKWYKNGTVISGAAPIKQTYIATTAGNYTVVVTANGCSSPASATITVTVNPIPAKPTISAGSAITFCDGGSVTLTSSAAGGNQWYKGGVAISGATNQTYSATTGGNYTVVVTAGGCSSPASTTKTVTVEPIPSTPTITAGSTTTFCSGGSVALTSSSASGNKWYKNGTVISRAASIQQTYNATTSGNYTVVVTTNGCSSPASAAITVTVNPIPAKPTISAGSAITFCDGGSVTLTSSAAGGNQWYKGGVSISGATNQTYNATTGGNYTVVVTAGGCSSPASTTKTVTVITDQNTRKGKEQNKTTNTGNNNKALLSGSEMFKVTVAPNPSTTDFHIKVESNSNELIKIRVIDVLGRVITTIIRVQKNSLVILGGNYRGGSYFAEVIQGANHKTVKMVKLIKRN